MDTAATNWKEIGASHLKHPGGATESDALVAIKWFTKARRFAPHRCDLPYWSGLAFQTKLRASLWGVSSEMSTEHVMTSTELEQMPFQNLVELMERCVFLLFLRCVPTVVVRIPCDTKWRAWWCCARSCWYGLFRFVSFLLFMLYVIGEDSFWDVLLCGVRPLACDDGLDPVRARVFVHEAGRHIFGPFYLVSCWYVLLQRGECKSLSTPVLALDALAALTGEAMKRAPCVGFGIVVALPPPPPPSGFHFRWHVTRGVRPFRFRPVHEQPSSIRNPPWGDT